MRNDIRKKTDLNKLLFINILKPTILIQYKNI